MAGRIITVAQQKGGAGKTTLAAHLAIAWHQAGRTVAVVDIDPQASLTNWYKLRTDTLNGQAGVAHSQISGWRTQAEVEKLAKAFDLVLIDSPPHAETEARIAVRMAHLVIVPVQPSPMDLWASRATLDIARQEKKPILLVLNRVPPRAKLTDALVGEIGKLVTPPEVDLAPTRIGNRTAYAGALFEGRSVTETAKRTTAANEIKALARHILERPQLAA